MSIARAFRRRVFRRLGSKWPGKDAQFNSLPDGGYQALHPTKGWRSFSAARLQAQARLRDMNEAINRRMGRI